MRRMFSFDGMAVGCVVIAGLVEAGQQALSGAPVVQSALPSFVGAPYLNYLPLILILLAGLFWVLNQTTARSHHSAEISRTADDVVKATGLPISGYDLIQSMVTMAKDIEDLGVDLENWWTTQHPGIVKDWPSAELERATSITGRIAQLKYIARELRNFGKRLDRWR